MAPLAAATRTRIATTVRLSGALAVVLIAAGTLMSWHFAPILPDCDVDPAPNCQSSPAAQKLFYVHVPVAFSAYAALTILAFASLRYLARHDDSWDALAASAGEVGVLMAGLTLLSGMVWGRAEWGVWWRNTDVKLVLVLILFLLYVGYLILRRQIDDPRRRGRVSATYAILSFVTVPLSYVAQRVWQSQHPTVFDPGNPNAGIDTPWVSETFSVNVLAFLALTVFMIALRYRNLLQPAHRERKAAT